MKADILVIEDDEILREAIAEWLRAEGYGVRTSEDGDVGLASIREAPPALVVTDLHLPGTSGAVIIGELLRHHPGIPVIAISGLFGSGFAMSIDEVLALGASRALAKPFRRGDLLRLIAELLPGDPAG